MTRPVGERADWSSSNAGPIRSAAMASRDARSVDCGFAGSSWWCEPQKTPLPPFRVRCLTFVSLGCPSEPPDKIERASRGSYAALLKLFVVFAPPNPFPFNPSLRVSTDPDPPHLAYGVFCTNLASRVEVESCRKSFDALTLPSRSESKLPTLRALPAPAAPRKKPSFFDPLTLPGSCRSYPLTDPDPDPLFNPDTPPPILPPEKETEDSPPLCVVAFCSSAANRSHQRARVSLSKTCGAAAAIAGAHAVVVAAAANCSRASSSGPHST
mmetsp:Transcript_14011/g.52543  ORF Transcript_14011/g.52543 Transcript_14011/m.52543 type:complete len:269 (-) Transcript_14011:317-1123(-)